MPKGPPRKRRPLLVLDFEEGSGGLRLAFGRRGRFWRLRGFALAILLVDHALGDVTADTQRDHSGEAHAPQHGGCRHAQCRADFPHPARG